MKMKKEYYKSVAVELEPYAAIRDYCKSHGVVIAWQMSRIIEQFLAQKTKEVANG